VQQPGRIRYLLVLLSFCLGLLAKPMIVTLPFVLLLLDIWPLGRANRRAVWEKAPLFLLAAGAAAVTFLAQEQGRAVRSLAAVPFGLRIENALVTYAAYIVRMFWPAHLAVFYPYPFALPIWQTAAAAMALIAITALAVRRARSHPYLAVGWFWYVGTLVPVIGLVQVGAQASADRYTYVPMTGLTIMLAWGAADLIGRRPGARKPIVALAAAAGAACIALTWSQLGHWADSEALFRHAVEVTSDNYIAHNNLANYYLVHARDREAAVEINDALRIKPTYADAHINLAYLLKRLGRLGESEREYQTALALQPANVEAHSGYGALLVAEGRTADALREFLTVTSLRPDYADGHYDLGRVLAAVGRTDEAMAEFDTAIRLRPDHADARRSLGFLLLSRGRMDEALVQFRAEARLKPDDAGIHFTVGQLLASAGRFDEAIAEFSEALRIKPDFVGARRSLEMAQAQRDKASKR
jgi:Tfp pilus assembly protein PilF